MGSNFLPHGLPTALPTGTHAAGFAVDTIPSLTTSRTPLELQHLNNGPTQAPSGVGSEMNPSTGNLDSATSDASASSTTPTNAIPGMTGTPLTVSNIWGAAMLLIVALIFVGLFHADKT